VIGEPRRALARRRESYDAIICQPSPPWDRNTAHRHTKEFFRTAASRLRPEGVLAASFPLVGIGEEHLRAFLAAFRGAFRHVVAFEATKLGTLVLIGSGEPLVIHVRDLEGIWGDASAQADLIESRVRSVYDLVAQSILDGEAIDRFVSGAPADRDGRAFVELGTEEYAATLVGGRQAPVLRALHQDPDRFLAYEGLSAEERGRFRREVARACWRNGYGFTGLRFAERAYADQANGLSAGVYGRFLKAEAGDLDSAISVVRSAWEEERTNTSLLRQLGEYLFLGRRHEECERLMTKAIEDGVEDAWCYVNRGRARLGLRRPEAALADLSAGKELDRLQDNSGDINYFIGVANKNLGRIQDAHDSVSRAIARNPRHIYAQLEYGEDRLLLGSIDRPTFEKEYVVPFNRARAETLFNEARAWLVEPGHAEEVERNLQAVINTTPNHYGAYLALAEFYFRRGEADKERTAIEKMLAQFGRKPEAIAEIEEYLRSTGGERRVRAFRSLLL
jgi:tetratricopeptide (TPR) repeat protein